MIICDDGHEEIVFCIDSSGECPLCKCNAERESLEWDINTLKDEVDYLRRELNNLAG